MKDDFYDITPHTYTVSNRVAALTRVFNSVLSRSNLVYEANKRSDFRPIPYPPPPPPGLSTHTVTRPRPGYSPLLDPPTPFPPGHRQPILPLSVTDSRSVVAPQRLQLLWERNQFHALGRRRGWGVGVRTRASGRGGVSREEKRDGGGRIPASNGKRWRNKALSQIACQWKVSGGITGSTAVRRGGDFSGQQLCNTWGQLCVCVCVCVCVRERERQTDRQTDRQTEKERETERQTETERDREKEGGGREGGRKTDIWRDRGQRGKR